MSLRQSRRALARLLIAVSGVVIGSGLFWMALRAEPRRAPPWLALVVIAIAVVALLAEPEAKDGAQ